MAKPFIALLHSLEFKFVQSGELRVGRAETLLKTVNP